ncbi:MAG TPA: hypothetical protein VFA46_18415 [Actinomycetes bacterium]|nr:hypothetical protein [Actinomycetes bacterium]
MVLAVRPAGRPRGGRRYGGAWPHLAQAVHRGGVRGHRRAKPEARILEVVEVRYDAGKFGSGYKDRPKSPTSIRPVPLPEQAAEVVARRLIGCPPRGRVFLGPAATATLGAASEWR